MTVEKTEYINRSDKKIKTPQKPAGVAIFWGLGLILAFVLVRHHNPLADQVTEQMKKVSGCVLITFTCIIKACNLRLSGSIITVGAALNRECVCIFIGTPTSVCSGADIWRGCLGQTGKGTGL